MSKNLTEHQIKLLSKGLKYTPIPKQNMEELRNDIKKFTRKIKLREYFYNEEKIEQTTTDTNLAIRLE